MCSNTDSFFGQQAVEYSLKLEFLLWKEKTHVSKLSQANDCSANYHPIKNGRKGRTVRKSKAT